MRSLIARRNAYIRCTVYNRRILARHKWKKTETEAWDSVSWAAIGRERRGEGIKVKRDEENAYVD